MTKAGGLTRLRLNLVGLGVRDAAAADGGLIGHTFFPFPPRAVWAAPTLHQLRLLGFSFLNSFFWAGRTD